jgi:hypothetical protein
MTLHLLVLAVIVKAVVASIDPIMHFFSRPKKLLLYAPWGSV